MARRHSRRPNSFLLDQFTYGIQRRRTRRGRPYQSGLMWFVRIYLPSPDGKKGTRLRVGEFATESEARRARDDALLKHIADAESIFPWLRRPAYQVAGRMNWHEVK